MSFSTPRCFAEAIGTLNVPEIHPSIAFEYLGKPA